MVNKLRGYCKQKLRLWNPKIFQLRAYHLDKMIEWLLNRIIYMLTWTRLLFSGILTYENRFEHDARCDRKFNW